MVKAARSAVARPIRRGGRALARSRERLPGGVDPEWPAATA